MRSLARVGDAPCASPACRRRSHHPRRCAHSCSTSSASAPRLRRAGRARRRHAARSVGAARLDHEGRVQGRPRARPARAGPLAAQLAIYLGWLARRRRSARRSSASRSSLPSFVMVLALAAVYLRYGGLPLDAGRVLRHRRGRHRHHRAQRVQAGRGRRSGGTAALGRRRR